MMQLPDLLNNNFLFKKLNGLQIKDNQSLEQTKEEIFSRGTSALLHLARIQELHRNCITEFEFYENQISEIKDERIVFSSKSLGYLMNEISPLMATLRLLQNLNFKLLRNLGYKNLPKSINTYFKKPAQHLTPEIHEILASHWNSTGEKLKHYRDVDQHYTSLTDRYFIKVKGIKKIIIELPDNPESKSPKNFLYSKAINALDFLNEAFQEIHKTFENIAALYGAEDTDHQTGISLSQTGLLVPASNRLLSLMHTEYYSTNTEGKVELHLEAIGISQLESAQLSVRKYFIDSENLEKAKKYYGLK